MRRVTDITGLKCGRFTAIRYSHHTKAGATWECKCECGNIRFLATTEIRRGKHQSCGCLQREQARAAHLKHGQCAYGKNNGTPEYRAWVAMRQRCQNASAPAFPNYGGRGIKVCDRWDCSFDSFFADMGLKPSPKMSLERLDNNGGYSPENCVWATQKTQGNNTRKTVMITHNGKTMSRTQWSELLGFQLTLIGDRINDGWSVAQALDTPVRGKAS